MTTEIDPWLDTAEPDDLGPRMPRDVEAERVITASAMERPEIVDELAAEGFDPADISTEQYRWVWFAVEELRTRFKDGEIRWLPIARQLEAWHADGRMPVRPLTEIDLSELYRWSQPGAAAWHAERVAKKAVAARIVALGHDAASRGNSAAFDPDTDVAALQDALDGVAKPDAAKQAKHVRELIGAALERCITPPTKEDRIPTGFMDLDALLCGGWAPGQMVVIGARPAMGKALALDTPLATPTGWTTMGDVKAGDYVLGADGKPTKVTLATDVQHGRQCYEVHFSDKSVIVADADHLWLTDTRASLKSAQAAKSGYGRYRNQRTFPAVRTTREIRATLRCKTADRRLNHSVVNAMPLALPDADLPIAPYTLGAWLGDGTSRGASITTVDAEILDRIRLDGYEIKPRTERLLYGISNKGEWYRRVAEAAALVRDGMPIERAAAHVKVAIPAVRQAVGGKATGYKRDYTPATQSRETRHQSVDGILRGLDVLGNKHIPALYLRASEKQRRDLLAGLLDTDGTVNNGGAVQFAVTSRRLAEDTLELIRSLGYKPGMFTKRVKGRTEASSTCYVISFTTADKVFNLSRKLARQKAVHSDARTGRRYITDIRPVESVPVRCIQVDNEDHLYLAGRSMIPTHNTTVASGFARAAAVSNGIATLFHTLEMSEDEIANGLLCAESRVALHHLKQGIVDNAGVARAAEAGQKIAAAPLFIDDVSTLTLPGLRAKVRHHVRADGLRLVIVDYLQLMTAPKAENRQNEVSKLSRGIKLLAREFGITVIILAQLNRGPEQRQDKRPMKSDLRESGSIEQDADIVILLHRDDAYERESPRAGEADLIVDKHRGGQIGTVTVASQLHFASFVDMAAP